MVPLLVALAFPMAADAAPAQNGNGAAPTAADSCAVPEALGAVGETSEARKAYVKVLKANPSEGCAREGLEALNEPKTKSPAEDCELGDTYRALHRDEDAVKAYEKALEAKPDAECAKKGLDEIGPSDLTRAVNWVVDGAVDLLVAFGIFLIVLFALLMLGWVPLLGRLIRKLPKVGRLIGPRLSIGDLSEDATDAHPGAPLSAAVKEYMQRLRHEATTGEPFEYDLDWPAPQEEFADFVSDDSQLKNALEKAGDISDQAKTVAALLSLAYAILPVTRLTLSGVVAPTDGGVGVALGLEKNGRLAATTTLSSALAKGKNPAIPDYVRLAKPAAVWTQFGIGRILGGRPIAPEAARSFGLLRQGLDSLKASPVDKVAARAFFQEAINLDPENWAAYVGAASIPDRDEDAYKSVIDSLLLGLEKIAGVDDA
jgi:tetratricopeptide (TPR) repeat protein